MIKKILFKSSTFRTIYSFIRFLLFCVILKRYKFLYDDNSVNIENLDLKSLGYDNEVKEAPGDYFKKIRDYEKKSLIKNGLKIENIFNMFSGNRSMLIINPILSLSYLNREKLKVLSVGPRTESEIFCLIGNGFRKENICSIDLQSYSSLIDTGDIHAINFNDNTFDIQQQQQQLNLKLNYNGIVTDKFIDKFEHSWPVIVLKNEKKIYVPENIYNKIKIKDSIFKKK